MTYLRLAELREKAILREITDEEKLELQELEKPTTREQPEKRPWWHSCNLDKREFAQALDGFLCAWFSELRCNRNYRTRDIHVTAVDILNMVKGRHLQLDPRNEPDPYKGMLTNTETLFFILGWQGGTIHQLSKTLGVEADEILYAGYEEMQELCRLAQQKRNVDA